MAAEFGQACAGQEPIFCEYPPTANDNGTYTVFNEAGCPRDEFGTPIFVEEAWRIQGALYGSKVYGPDKLSIVTEAALTADGSLLADLDLMRGSRTIYTRREEVGDSTNIATVREWYPLPGQTYKDAPSYRRCIQNAFPGVDERFAELIDQGYEIGEAGALAAALTAPSASTYSVFRKIVRNAVEVVSRTYSLDSKLSQTPAGLVLPKKKAWIIGMVTETHRRFKAGMGGGNLEEEGDDTFFDPRVNYPLRFATIIPDQFNDNLYRDYQTALRRWQRAQSHGFHCDPRSWQRLAERLLYFSEGLEKGSGHMSAETWECQAQLREQQEKWSKAA